MSSAFDPIGPFYPHMFSLLIFPQSWNFSILLAILKLGLAPAARNQRAHRQAYVHGCKQRYRPSFAVPTDE